MRGMIITFVLLVTAGCLASTMPLRPLVGHRSDAAAHDDGWRRTTDGWEKRASWHLPGSDQATATGLAKVHPFALAALQILVSLLALVAIGDKQARRVIARSWRASFSTVCSTCGEPKCVGRTNCSSRGVSSGRATPSHGPFGEVAVDSPSFGHPPAAGPAR